MCFRINQIIFAFIGFILFVPLAQSADLSIHKETCKEIGFKEGTETYGNCVLELYKRYRADSEVKVDKRERDEAKQRQIREENRARSEQRRADKERLALDKQRLELERRRQVAMEEELASEKRRRRAAAFSQALGALNKSLYPTPAPPPPLINNPSSTTCFMNGDQLQCNTR